MAPPRAARSTSRRDTPVSPPKTTRPVTSSSQPLGRRSTRSQSRGVSVASDDESNLAGQPVQESKENKVPASTLDTVPEHVEVNYPELKPSDASDAVIDLGDDEFDASSSAHSGITSYTQYERSKLDPESMINALPFLYQYSGSILNLFSSGDAAQLQLLYLNLQNPASRPSKKLHTLLEGFMLNRNHFGDDTAIDLDLAVRVLAGLRQADEIPDEGWRPDAVLYMANLARYISTIYASSEESEDAREILTSMFNSFPSLFGLAFHVETRQQGYYSSDVLLNGALSLVLEIRTQYLLQQLSRFIDHPAFDPDDALRAIFYVDHDRLRGPDYMDELSSLPSNFESIFIKQITTIRRHFSSNITNPVDLDGLREIFPYTGFLVRLARWAQLMAKQLENVIHLHGGLSQILIGLQDEFDRRQSGEEDNLGATSGPTWAERHDEALQSSGGREMAEAAKATGSADLVNLPTPTSPSQGPASKSARKKSLPMKSLEWRAKQQQIHNEMLAASRARKAAKAAEKAQIAMPSETEVPASTHYGEDDVPVLPSPSMLQDVPPPSQQVFTALEILRRHKEQSNKENIDNSRGGKRAFIDKQPGAERITFDSQEEISAVHQKGSTKRKTPETDDDNEDDDFELDPRSTYQIPPRQVAPERQRLGEGSKRSKTAINEHASSGAPSKRARIEHPPRNTDEEEEEEEEEENDDDDDDYNIAASSQLRKEEADGSRYHDVSSVPPNLRLPLHERPNVPPSSSAPVRESSAVLPVATQLAALNRQARQNTLMQSVKRTQPQQRLKWTDEEVARLVNLIEDYGVSWSKLLRFDQLHPDKPRLDRRNEGALKDKARNLKMDFLKARAQLPHNFEDIKLGGRLVGILKAHGIEYEDR